MIGRMVSDTFAGIAPASAPGFIGVQAVGAALAVWLHHALQASRRAGHAARADGW